MVLLANVFYSLQSFGQGNQLSQRGLTQSEADQLYQIMEITDRILRKNNIPYSIEGGSLLGAVRHKGLIPWDDDGDFDVLQSDLEKIKALAPEFSKYGLEVIDVPGWGLQVFYEQSPELINTNWNGKKSKKPFLDLISIAPVTVVEWKRKIEAVKAQIKKEEIQGSEVLNPKLKEIDKIKIEMNDDEIVYVSGQDVGFHDYPGYHVTREEWEGPRKVMPFGHLKLLAYQNPIPYLNRTYDNWNKKVEILMDHDNNVYYDKPITGDIPTCAYKAHSRYPSVQESVGGDLQNIVHNLQGK